MAEPVSAPDVRSIHATFEALFNAGDLEGLVELYAPDAVVNASPETSVFGKEAIHAALQGFLELGGKISLTTRQVFEHPGGTALMQADWSVKGGSTDLAGKSAEVLQRQPDGRWLYIIDNPWA